MLRLLSAALLALLGLEPLVAQSVTTPRPRIALVLEGGGALGFAHIGVIEWLENHHIPVDYVAGTSMGGLVGGLYATGRDAAEIRSLTESLDWNTILAGQTPFADLSFRRKEDRLAYPNRLEFGLRNGLQLPSGLNTGTHVGAVLDKVALPYGSLKSFDELPIPFRCVATDMTEGKRKVFDSGPLALALRATMSIPAVFSPVTIDGHTYTDGATVDNLPVDVAREMGADIVIAVYLDTGQAAAKSYNLVSVAAQNVAIMVAANELNSMKDADILLKADLHEFTSSSFTLGSEIVPRGVEAAERKSKLLSRLSVSDEVWQEYLNKRRSRIKREVPEPQFIQVAGTSKENANAIGERLTPLIGEPIQTDEIEKSLSRLTGLGVFSNLDYSLIQRNGQQGLLIRASEKSWSPPVLNLGITIDGSDPDDVRFGMGGRVTFLNLGGFRSELRLDGSFGTSYGLAGEYYRPLKESSKWFVAPHVYTSKSRLDLYLESQAISRFDVLRDGFGIDAGYTFEPRAEFRVGEDLTWFNSKLKIGQPIEPSAAERSAVTMAQYRFYGQDDATVPRSGLNLLSSFRWFGASSIGKGYPEAKLQMSYFHRIDRPGSVFFTGAGGTTFGTDTLRLNTELLTLGGPNRLGAYGTNELLGNQYFLTQAGYERELLRLNPFIGQGLYGLAFFEVGKVYASPIAAPALPLDGSLALLMKTALGPVYFGASFGNNDHRKWWFGVGRVF